MSLFADAEEWQLSVGAQTWAGLAWGERDAPPALLLHGWLDNAGSFAPLARLLAGRRLWRNCRDSRALPGFAPWPRAGLQTCRTHACE